MSLRRWFQEKWVDTKTGKPCGRQKGEKRKGYPACRPSRRVSSKTPKTTGEMSKGEKAKFNRTKTCSRRINYNHKRRTNRSKLKVKRSVAHWGGSSPPYPIGESPVRWIP